MGFFRHTIEVHMDAVCCDVEDCDADLSLSIEDWAIGRTINDKAIAYGWTFDGPLAACPECSKKKGEDTR